MRKLRAVERLVAGIAFAMLAGCTGMIAGAGNENGGNGAPVGSGGTASSAGDPSSPDGSGGEVTVAEGIHLPGSPKYYRFIRLTSAQWARSVQDVLHLAAPSGLESTFEGVVAGTTDFTNNELLLDVSSRSWSDFQTASETLADQVTATDSAVANVYATTDAIDFIKTVGRRAYRRPLTDAEVATYKTLFDSGGSMSGTRSAFAKGAALVIRALLQSPYFLYRVELGANGALLDGYEVAAKLSLWLRNTTPSDALLDAASTLTTAEAVASITSAMLGEATATQMMRDFHRQYLHLDRFDTLSKLGVPSYSQALNAEYKESSYLFFDEIFSQNLGLTEILTSTRGFYGPGMAPFYGLSASGSGYVAGDLGAQRAGFFSQLPYLSLNAFNDEPDSIHRGVTVNLDILCAPLGPPAVVIPPVPPLEEGQTNRQRISELTAPCGQACHNAMINPIGFAFEHFDGMGQYRDTENGGLPIDSSGSYYFSEGEKSFKDNVELMKVIASGEQAHLCYSKKLASFALGRDVIVNDMPLLKALAATSMATGGSLKQVMLELVRSDTFRTHVGGQP